MMNTAIAKAASRNIRLQGWINFCMGITFLIPVITLLYTKSGLSLPQIVVVANVSSIAVWLLDIPTSIFADTMGRTRFLRYSVLCNLIAACTIFLFPWYAGYLAASFFAGLYMSFWSGTGQSFLAENLEVLQKPDLFGRTIGRFMFAEQLALFCAPFIASGILFFLPVQGFRILAALDVLSAVLLVIFTLQLREIHPVSRKLLSFRRALSANIATARDAFVSVFQSPRLRLLLLYRSLGNHVAYLPLIILPLLLTAGMLPWIGGIIVAFASLASMFASRYTYLLGERRSYNGAWVFATIMQGILLIIAGMILQHWILLAVLFVLFNLFEGMWQPAWNHVLVEETHGHAVATTRSIVFSCFALYTTFGKQMLVFFQPSTALIGLGIFVLLVNIFLARSLLRLHANADRRSA